MNPPVTRQIQGTEYTFYVLPALPAWPVWLRLQKLGVGPLLQVTGTPDVDLGVSALARALAALVQQLEPEDRERLVLPLLSKVTCNGVRVGGDDDTGRAAFSLHFAGKYGLLLEVIVVAIEVNFLDFYSVLKGIVLGAATQLADLAPPKTSDQQPATAENPE